MLLVRLRRVLPAARLRRPKIVGFCLQARLRRQRTVGFFISKMSHKPSDFGHNSRPALKGGGWVGIRAGHVAALLQTYAENPAQNWKAKNCAIYLVVGSNRKYLSFSHHNKGLGFRV